MFSLPYLFIKHELDCCFRGDLEDINSISPPERENSSLLNDQLKPDPKVQPLGGRVAHLKPRERTEINDKVQDNDNHAEEQRWF